MEQINKENIEKFMEYYHALHDSLVTEVNYSITKSQIEVLIDVFEAGEAEKKVDGESVAKKTKLRMIFDGVERCNNKEMFTWDYVDNAYMKYVTLEGKEFICFASDEVDPMLYIVSDSLKYEEIKNL